MKSILCIAALVINLSAGAANPQPKDYSAEQKADVLFWQMEALGQDMREKKWDAIVSTLPMGVVLGVTGALMLGNPNRSYQEGGIVALGLGAGFALGAGILSFIEIPEERSAAKLFSGGEALRGQAKLDFYEKALQKLASDGRSQRYFAAGASVVIGVLATTLGLALPDTIDNREGKVFFQAIGPALTAGAMVMFFHRTGYEAKWDNYQKHGLLMAHQSGPALRVALAPGPGGASAALGLQF